MFVTILAFSMVVVFMTLIMTKRLSAMTALILVPTVFAVIGGFGADMGPMMLDGIVSITPTAVMLMFAILYFGIMIDAGLFDPLVTRIVRLVDGDPVKVAVGTAALALAVALDGDGATTYMVMVAAMMPLYRRMRMNTLVMASLIMMSTSVMNILPWGGPAGRVASSLGVDMNDLFVPMIPAMLGSGFGVMLIAYRLGVSERRRLGMPAGGASPAAGEPLASVVTLPAVPVRADAMHAAAPPQHSDVIPADVAPVVPVVADPEPQTAPERRPRLWWVNLGTTILLMAALLTAVLPLSVLFMLAFSIALLINYPSLIQQKERIAAHAGNALAVSGLIFAAGIFTGILSGTRMVDAMATAIIQIIPPSMGPHMATVAGLMSIPGTFFISYDAFYFGVMPVIAEAGAAYGIGTAEIARASLIGAPVHALSPLTASTYVLIGLAGIELGDHQRFSLKWTLLVALLMLALLIVTGAVSLARVGSSGLPRAGKDWSELLNPFPHIDFANVHVALRVDSNRVRKGHLAGQAAAATEVPDRLAALPLDNPNDVVVRVGDEQILLLRIFRNHHLVHGAADRLVERHGRCHGGNLREVQAAAPASLRG